MPISSRWQRFLSAEVDACLVREILADLKLETYIRRFKTNAGHTLGQNSDDLISLRFEGITESLELAAHSFSDQSEQNISFEESFIRSYVLLSELLETIHHVETIARPSPTSGWLIMNRYFCSSAKTTSGRDDPVKASQRQRSRSNPPGMSDSIELGYKSDTLAYDNPMTAIIAETGE
jgi:hypothetical protein